MNRAMKYWNANYQKFYVKEDMKLVQNHVSFRTQGLSVKCVVLRMDTQTSINTPA